ncbi:Ger(x)C family spore germination protein [Shimazuella sp. AN120528]|uniref:Ger(x)C family spore germination protein n=1 Tax=Shimazuella soli TaxID=1892854 RepID=UPI001F0EB461|nr:Ger(x)C family spore germination protein [Shimazuella soli]MCH5584645.1 Ger(x)C family spore germination protein [Shimazuella soli]
MYRFRYLILIICFCLFLTGCWDSHDIEQLNIHVGTALDKASSSTSNGKQQSKNAIKLTTQSIFNTQPTTESDQANQEPQKYINISGVGNSIIEIVQSFSQENEHPSYGQHLKVIVIGEALAKTMNIGEILDQHSRTYEIRDSCILLVAEGSAADTLNIHTDIPSFTLIDIDQHQYKTAKLLPPLTIGKAVSKMAAHKDFIIQGVQTKKGKINFNRAALIKGGTNRLVGFLNEEEIEGLNWLMGKAKGGIIKGRDPKTGGLIMYEIVSVKNKITPYLNGDHISFDVNIESVGRLNEDWVLAGNAFSNKFIKRAEIATEKEVRRQIHQTLTKLQKYQIDVAGFNEQFRIHYPKEWKRMKKDWDKRFSHVPITYHIHTTIRDYMVKGRKEISK